ncbi:hypothetical protein COT60_02035 [Candidatus Pacearchaeota archaeon CG09_land_8_20_14_0_10_30_9]|nr:MAG: hypothetical protein COV77_03950 [Candidatus Pacearchaeota archaeon CG11_big_fil_rev_8_21_14_0_20_30_13]PIO01140.1 MAG: hypothetical protein COT60_02035 [Candidatus Pacearchaeota archaeon CG09_land_8_20_14_0_10_30_9]PIZ82138.1 MAG: hypothetical protein COX98_00965 [Candidatus Pacearchaeota archaeon CG_4_10_14_0_2_um_filter_30_11]PJA71139.1 MAG: hypothetical protein CO153_03115 [Candidatus Pacearchaeota archaeon CG_4_9_14_3_um_filter_30_11]
MHFLSSGSLFTIAQYYLSIRQYKIYKKLVYKSLPLQFFYASFSIFLKKLSLVLQKINFSKNGPEGI